MKPIPDGYATVTPWLISHDTPRLIDYVTEAFGAVELARVAGADGRVEHAEIRIGDSVVMLFDAAPGWPPTPASCASTCRTRGRHTAGRSPWAGPR